LFHHLCNDIARDLLPNATAAQRAEVARWINHNDIQRAAQEVKIANTNRTDSAAANAIRAACAGAVPSDLVQLADAFISLREARHLADYDGNYDPVRGVTRLSVEQARAAIKLSESLWRSRNSPRPNQVARGDGYSAFLRLALCYTGGPKKR